MNFLTNNYSRIRRNSHLVAFTSVLVFGAAIRFINLSHESLWYDELYSIWARKLPLKDLIPEVLAAGHPPIFNSLAHYWLWLGSSVFWVRSISAVFGLGTVVLVYMVCIELFSRRIALWAAAFTAFSPFLVWYSRDATSYSWIMFIFLFSFYLLVRSIRIGGWKNWTAYVLVTTVGFFSHYFAISVFLAGLATYWLLRDSKKNRLLPWVVSEAFLSVMLATSLIIGRLTAGSNVNITFPPVMSVVKGLGTAPYIFLEGYVHYSIGSNDATLELSLWRQLILLLSLLFIVELLFFYKEYRKRVFNRTTAAVALYTFMLVVISISLQLMREESIAGRYYSFAAPTFIILFAVLISAAPRKIGAVAGVVIIVALIFFTGWEIEGNHNDNWRALMNTISIDQEKNDHILCFPLHHCVMAADFYLPSAPPISGGIIEKSKAKTLLLQPQAEVWVGYKTGYDMGESNFLTETALKNRFVNDLSGTEKLWLVAGDSTSGSYPEAVLAEEALTENWVLTKQWNFSPLILKEYVRKQ